jgi:hypothetical protein
MLDLVYAVLPNLFQVFLRNTLSIPVPTRLELSGDTEALWAETLIVAFDKLYSGTVQPSRVKYRREMALE